MKRIIGAIILLSIFAVLSFGFVTSNYNIMHDGYWSASTVIDWEFQPYTYFPYVTNRFVSYFFTFGVVLYGIVIISALFFYGLTLLKPNPR